MLGFDARAARGAWTFFAIAILIYGAYLIRTTIFVFILAILLAYMVHPLLVRIERWLPKKVPRAMVVSMVFALLITCIIGTITTIGSQVADEAASLREQIPQWVNGPELANRIPLPDWLEGFRPRMLNWIKEHVMPGAAEALPLIQSMGLNILHWAGNIIFVVLVPILSFILLNDAPNIRAKFRNWTNTNKERAVWRAVVRDVDVILAQYIRALLLLSLATFTAYSIAFALLGAPYPLLLAAIAALMEFVPLFGPLVAAGIAIAVSAVAGYAHIVWLLIFIAFYRVFQDYVLNPYLMSEGAEVHPVLVILGLLAGEQLAGVAGMFLSLPAIALVRILIKHVPLRATAEPS